MSHVAGPRFPLRFGALLLAITCFNAYGQTGAAPVELYLEVSVNGEPTGTIARFTQEARVLRSSVQNLRDLGLDPKLLGVADQEEVTLDTVTGLTYTYDARRQSIDLRVADALRRPLLLQTRSVRQTTPGTVNPGLLLNYDMYVQSGSERHVAATHELRYFNAGGVFSSSGNAMLEGPRRGYIRYDTSWTHSDPAKLETIQLGDFISPSLTWTRSMRMAGIEWRKNFELRPDMVTYPVAALGGSAVVPSNVTLYVNGMQQFSAQVPSGPFLVDQIAGLNGAGQATIVTRDALGRSVSMSLPLYVDTRLLARDLTDYSLEIGALRRDYGMRSFSYAGSPSASATLRHGWSDALTLEAHAETGRTIFNAGFGGLIRLGQAGVVNASLSASGGSSRGLQTSLGYQYISSRFSFDAQSLRASPNYGDLGTAEGAPVSSVNDRISLNLSLPRAQSASVNYVRYQSPQQQPARIAALAYSLSIGYGAYFSISGFIDLQNRQARGMLATLSVTLGGKVTLNTGMGMQNGERNQTVTMSRAPDFEGGLGWGLQKGTIGNQAFDQAQVQYLGKLGQLTASTQNAGGRRSTALDVTGAVVVMDGVVVPARQTGRGFALVTTGTPNVPVLQENRRIGLTDDRGYLLIPDLIPYSTNQIAIDTSQLPANARVRTPSMNVVPQRLAGVLAQMPIERFSAASIIVHLPDNRPLPVGTPVQAEENQTPSVVGYDGIVFVDGLRAQNRLVFGRGSTRCAVDFAYQPPAGDDLPVIGPLICLPLNGKN